MLRTVAVVGGSSGLGKVVAQRYALMGHGVAIISRNKPGFANDVANIRHFSADMMNLTQSGADALAKSIVDCFGTLGYVIFCQRYRGEAPGLVSETTVSITSTDLLIQAFRPHFDRDKDCAIATVSSVYADYVGSSQPLSYHIVKAGLNALVRYYAVELGREGIRVNAIAPLTYLKDESKHFYLDNEQTMEKYRRLVPLKRMPTSGECADALSYLCSPQASYVNGQVLYVDGGVSAIWPEELA